MSYIVEISETEYTTIIDLDYNMAALILAILKPNLNNADDAFKAIDKNLDNKILDKETRGRPSTSNDLYKKPIMTEILKLRNQKISIMNISNIVKISSENITKALIKYSKEHPNVYIYLNPAISKQEREDIYVKQFKQGKSIKDIAKENEVTEHTIRNAIRKNK